MESDPAQLMALFLGSGCNDRFLFCLVAPFARMRVAEVKLIDFNYARELFSLCAYSTASEFVKPTPGDIKAFKSGINKMPDDLRRKAKRQLMYKKDKDKECAGIDYRKLVKELHSFALYDQVPFGFLILDQKGLIIDINRAGARLFGTDRSSVINRQLLTYVHFDEQRMSFLFQKEVYKSSFPHSLDLQVKKKGGHPCFVRLTTISQKVIDANNSILFVFMFDITDQKKVQEELKASEKKYRNLIEHANDAIICINRKGRICEVNKKAEEMYGYSKKELLGKSPIILTKSVLKNQIKHMNEFKETGTMPFEKKIAEGVGVRKNGQEFFAEVSFYTVEANGEPIITAAIRDITARQKAQEAIRLSREKYENITKNVPLLLYSIRPDKESSTIFISSKCYAWTGYLPTQYYSHKGLWRKCIHPEERKRILEIYYKSIKEKRSFDIEYRIVHKDTGVVRHVSDHGVAIKDSKGAVLQYDGIVRDITDSKQMNEIRKQKNLLEAISKVLWGTMHAKNPRILANLCLTSAEQLTGSKHGYICDLTEKGEANIVAISNGGLNACKMAHNAAESYIDKRKLRGIDRSIIKEGKSRIVNDPASHPDRVGTPKNHLPIKTFMGIPLKDKSKTIGLIALAGKEEGYNETDQKIVEALAAPFVESLHRVKAEEEIRKLNEDLKEKVDELYSINQELSAFSYSVSHDLRAPLRAIDGFSALLLQDSAEHLDAQGKKYLDRIRTNVVNMGRLIDDLLDFTRISRKDIKLAKIHMVNLARSVFSSFKQHSLNKELQLKVGKLPPAWGDRSMIRQVISNLMSNSIKFSHEKKPLVIDFGYWGREKDNEVYYVKDNGVGFDMKYVGKLFIMFQRLYSQDKYEGTGVGLAVVKRIIERHEGRVWAEGKVNQGATFYFSIPGERRRL